MKTAKLIKKLSGWNGDARLYKLSQPCKITRIFEDKEDATNYVVVSAVHAMFSGPETYIFAADENGEVESYGELEGSFRGAFDHAKALSGLGYVIEAEARA